MTSNNNQLKKLVLGVVVIFIFGSCQKLYRPALGDYLKDPDPPPYNALKGFWAFEDNVTDQGENDLDGTASNLSYVTGINGKAVQVGAGGYLLCKTIGETTVHPNGFVGYPADTLASLKSFSVSFWMKGVGPVQGGAQGIFSLSNKNQFWGNLDVFLENYNSGDDAFFKVHLFNKNGTGTGETWIADNAMKFTGVLNKWTHVVFTYDAATSVFKSYIDGNVANQRNLTSGGNPYGDVEFKDFNGLVIGSFQFQTNPTLSNHGPEAWAKSFNGALDQFRLYNKALSAAEVTDLFVNKK